MTNNKSCKLLFTALWMSMVVMISSCNKEDFITDKSAKIKFSTDTVLFDTVFVTRGSATKHFMVYNPHKQSIKIDDIRLARGKSSPYRINVDGESGIHIEDIEILPNDSIYIFVDVNIDPADPDLVFIEKDSITFSTNGNLQDIKLVAWGQNAHFFHDSMLPCNMVWTNDKPYVISNHIGIAAGCKLTIEKGATVYSDNGSGIFVWGELETQGTVEEPVVFRGLRLESYYNDLPGQWYGIRFLPGSQDNYLYNTHIRNATIGIEVDSLPASGHEGLTLYNTRIENMSSVGILAYTAQIKGYNCAINNCCQYLMVGELGGDYEFYHASFAHISCNCLTENPAVYFNNTDYDEVENDLNLLFINSIIWGSQDDELIIESTGAGSISLTASNNLIKTTETDYNVNNNILNQNPKFINGCNYNYQLDTLSPGFGSGMSIVSLPTEVQKDLNDVQRKNTPDIGAFERIE